jgi:phosphoribosylanthranilate isomerase
MPIAVKICGLSTAAAVEAAVAGGARWVGFNFYPPSPRAVTPQQAAALCALVPPQVRRVGLFVDADDAAIDAALAAAPLELLQFHGRESADRVAEARVRFGREVIKAVPLAGPQDIAAAGRYEDVADLLLFDAKPPLRADALPGGNGLAFDWSLLVGTQWRRPWMLSGGLNAALLPEAVRISGSAAVDVSSGVETRPGMKNIAKIREFLAVAGAL